MNTFYIFLAQGEKLNNNSGKNEYFLFLDCNNHCTIYMHNIYILPLNYL